MTPHFGAPLKLAVVKLARVKVGGAEGAAARKETRQTH